MSDFSVSWSSDSRWMAYDRGEDNRNNSIFIYETENSTRKRVTSLFYNEHSPVFDTEGKYLHFLTNRSFNPVYSDFDNTFAYTNSTHIMALSLQKDTPAVTAPKNDEVGMKEENESFEDEEKEEGKNHH